MCLGMFCYKLGSATERTDSSRGKSGMRVLVADDQATVRSALRRLLQEQPGFHVVAEVIRGEKLLDQAAATEPALVLLDWEREIHRSGY
jgi:PleD family two-component response regulator